MKIYSGGPLDVPNETLAQMFHRVAAANPARIGFRSRPGKGQPYREWTWTQTADRIEAVGNALLSSGLAPGERVAIVSDTRMEWSLADWGVLSAGGVVVTVYPTLTDEQVSHLLKDSGSTLVFAEDQKQLEKVARALPANPQVRRIVTLTPCEAPADVRKTTIGFEAFEEEGRAFAQANPGKLRQRIDAQKPADLATLVYTSGTTGVPKGAMLTHRNFTSALAAAQKVLQIPENLSTVQFLPLAHCYGRLQLQLAVMLAGNISFSTPSSLVEDFKTVRPHFIASVPRLYERMYAQILKRVEDGPAGKQRIFHRAADVAREYGRALSDGGRPGLGLQVRHAIFDKLVYGKLRDALGMTEMKVSITGAAAIRPDLLYFFQGIGVPILEGYGLTETSAPSNVNPPHKFRPGSVGPPFPGMEMTLADDGEVLMRGPNVFKGYYNLPGETKEAFTDDGWFRTGDLGAFDDDGYLRIVDRKKELEVLNTGKKIAPVTVEEKLKLSPFCGEALLVATDKKFAGCLIQPNFDALVSWADKNGVAYDKSRIVIKPDPTGTPTTYAVGQDLLDNPKVKELYQKAVDECNARCADFEQIRVWRLADHMFTVDRDELTPSLKKKRRVIVKNYKALIDGMFSG